MRRQFFSLAGPLNDGLEAGVGRPVQGAVSEDGVVEEAEPLLHAADDGDDEAGDSVAADDQLVEVGGLLAGEPVAPQVVQDQQVRGEEGSESPAHRVVDSGLGHGPIVVIASLDVGWIILGIAGLNFLGLGAQPPTPEWEARLNDDRPHLQTAPRLLLLPGSAIFVAVLGFNLLGDGLRDLLDPRISRPAG